MWVMRVRPGRLFERPRASIVGGEAAGSGARVIELRVDGMVCDICAGRVRRALEGVAGVERAEMDLATGRATVQVRGQVDGRELMSAVEGKVVLSWARGVLARLRWWRP